jgi:hypothetical protein
MKCRAFRGRFYVLAPFAVGLRDLTFAVAATAAVFGLAAMEWIWPIP